MKLEEVLIGLAVGVAAFKVLDGKRVVKNSGELSVVAAQAGREAQLAPVADMPSRDPNVSSCAMEPPQMLSTSLLPADNQPMSDADFVGITPEKLQQVNFLSTGWALGRDTQSNTLRNPSYDLRSEPINPQTLSLNNNSFLNSTIGFPDVKRPFEMQSPVEQRAGGEPHAHE